MKSHFLVQAAVLTTACGVVMGLAGCSEERSSQQVATLDATAVKGIRFDAPVEAKPALTAAGATATTDGEPLTMLTPAPSSAVDNEIAEQAAPLADDATSVTEIVLDNATVGAGVAVELMATPTPVTTVVAAAAPEIAPLGTTPTAAPAPVGPTPEIPKVSTTPGEFTPIPFAVLAGYKYVEPIPMEGEKPEEAERRRAMGQIPPEILALDGANALVEGWMVPLEITDEGQVKSFILVNKPPECCFGDMQAMNEWIDVVMEPGKHAEFNVDRPIKVSGKLEVGEKTEDGFVLSVYRMKAENAQL